MKKNKLIIAAVFLIGITIQSCSKDESLTPNEESSAVITNLPNANGLVVSQRQRAVVTYVGATWCPPCGAYGDPAKISMESTHGSDVVILNVQFGDAISQQGAFGPNFGLVFQTSVNTNGIPHAYWSGANFAMVDRGFYTSASANNSAADRDINSIKGDTPNVGIAAKATIVDNSVNVETLTKFYKAAAGLYIGVYLLEDGVEASQSISNSPNAITSHENVVRAAAFMGNSLGVESIGTSFTADQEVLGSYTIKIPNTVLDRTKLQVAVVAWETNQANGISNAILIDVK